jgi:hypothetical protein
MDIWQVIAMHGLRPGSRYKQVDPHMSRNYQRVYEASSHLFRSGKTYTRTLLKQTYISRRS